jgi:hypothetical protein
VDVAAFLVQVSTVKPGEPAEFEMVCGSLKAIDRSTMKARPG